MQGSSGHSPGLLLVELHVARNDRRDGSSDDLLDIAFAKRGKKARLGWRRSDEDEACWAQIGARHRDLTTTQRYMHLSPAALDQAIRLLEPSGVLGSLGDTLETGSTETAKSFQQNT